MTRVRTIFRFLAAIVVLWSVASAFIGGPEALALGAGLLVVLYLLWTFIRVVILDSPSKVP